MTTALPPTITDATVTLREASFIPGISAGQYFGYCSVAGVLYEFTNLAEEPQLVSTINGVTPQSRVAQEIFGAAVELQAELDHFYVMPYTGSSSNILAQLFDLNAKLATARILKRFFTGAEANKSVAAAELEAWVTEFYTAVASGKIRWDSPFGDAQPRAMNPVYDLSSAITIAPSPYANDLSANPMFSVSQSTTFSRERVM